MFRSQAKGLPSCPFLLPPPLSYVRCHPLWLSLKGLFGAQKALGGWPCWGYSFTKGSWPHWAQSLLGKVPVPTFPGFTEVYWQLQLNNASSHSYEANWEADVEKADHPLGLLAAGQQGLGLWGGGGKPPSPLSHRRGHTVGAVGCSSWVPSALFGVTVILLWVNWIWGGAKGAD